MHICMYVWLAYRAMMCLTIELAVQGENINKEKYDANHYTHTMRFIHWPLRAAPKPAQRDEQIAQLITTK